MVSSLGGSQKTAILVLGSPPLGCCWRNTGLRPLLPLPQGVFGLGAALPAHFGAGAQRGANGWARGVAKNFAAQLRIELHAGHARWLALRHSRNGRRNRRHGAAGSAAAAARRAAFCCCLHAALLSLSLSCNRRAAHSTCSSTACTCSAPPGAVRLPSSAKASPARESA